MGFLKGFSKGGGFLNNVDGVIESYEFTDKGPKEKRSGEWVYFVPSILVDGSEEAVTQHMFAGAAENFEIRDDGLTLTPNEGTRFSLNTPMGLFLGSLVEKGFPESDLPDLEAGEPLNLEAINGTRVRFVQQVNEKSTAKAGKRKDKKTGKEYDRTDTVVAAVYLDAPKEVKKGTKATTTAAKGTKAASKPNGRIKEEEPDLTETADELILEILGDKEKIARKALSIETTKRRMKHPYRDPLRELISSDDYLEGAVERGVIEFNQKTQVITAA